MEGVSTTYVSTIQAAQALGVSVSTIKRWVDEHRLPAHKTAGGHRKLLRADVLALAREGALPRKDLTELFPAADAKRQLKPRDLATALFQSLVRGDAGDARALIRRGYRSAMPLEVLADQVIAPVMRQIGHEWEADRLDVWQEHRGSQVCLAALHELQAEITERADPNRPVAVGGTPPGDPYQLATLLAQLTLLDAGWNAVNLGPNTPLVNLLEAARDLKPRLIWLSASHLEDAAAFVNDFRALQGQLQPLGIAVALGGQALGESVRSQLPYTTYGDGLSHLAAFARSLHPQPGLPRRGRPVKKTGRK